ncbi:transposase, partial [candidate division WOR-3 bacterium]|nr:transposase [candidate division WOR-3 bacterium]
MEFFLGCDVSKGYADFVILDSKKNIVERNFQLDDTFERHAKLYEVLSIFQEKYPSAIIYAGLESTGGYENNWFRSLRRFGDTLNIRVARLNPYGVNHSGKAGLGRNITDKISAYNIAEYLINNGEKVDYDSRDYMGALRKKWKFTNMLTKHLVDLRNELESLVYTNNTEVSMYCKDGMS